MIDARAIHEPQFPAGGFATRSFDDRNWTIQQFTGYPTSSVGGGNWQRGQIVRKYQPELRPPMLGLVAYDPTDPNTWGKPGPQ